MSTMYMYANELSCAFHHQRLCLAIKETLPSLYPKAAARMQSVGGVCIIACSQIALVTLSTIHMRLKSVALSFNAFLRMQLT